MATKNKQLGFSLIELMAVLAVAAITFSVALPQWSKTIQRMDIKAESNRLVRSIQYARSEAVNKQHIVTLQRKSTYANDWSKGWTIFSDAGGEGNEVINTGDGDILLKDFSANTEQLSLYVSTNANQFITFDTQGRTSPTGIEITIGLCDSDLTTSIEGRLITISSTGRTSIATITAANKSNTCVPN